MTHYLSHAHTVYTCTHCAYVLIEGGGRQGAEKGLDGHGGDSSKRTLRKSITLTHKRILSSLIASGWSENHQIFPI